MNAELNAAVVKFWGLVKRGEDMGTAFNSAAEFVDSERSSERRWQLIDELGTRIGYRPWVRP